VASQTRRSVAHKPRRDFTGRRRGPRSQAEPKGSLRARGYARFQPDLGPADRVALTEIQTAIADLPKDPYAVAGRFRWLGKGVVLRGDDIVHWVPDELDANGSAVSTYVQESLNPEFPGVKRQFAALPPHLKANSLLAGQVLRDLDMTFWSNRDLERHLLVHVHVISLRVTKPGEEAKPSPPCLHRDGEPFTFVHLIKRENVAGGINALAPPECEGCRPEEIRDKLIAQFELTAPFESYGVVDSMVSHHVDGVRQADATMAAERAVVLIDFTPLAPQLVP
jgi:hypothetical protein